MRARRTAFTRLETILAAWLRASLLYLRPTPAQQGRSGSRTKRLETCSIVDTQKLDELRQLDRALADGEARIKKQLDIIAHLGLLGADPTRAKTVLDAMLSAQAERERYREMALHPIGR